MPVNFYNYIYNDRVKHMGQLTIELLAFEHKALNETLKDCLRALNRECN